jgi:hypothetical protein
MDSTKNLMDRDYKNIPNRSARCQAFLYFQAEANIFNRAIIYQICLKHISYLAILRSSCQIWLCACLKCSDIFLGTKPSQLLI